MKFTAYFERYLFAELARDHKLGRTNSINEGFCWFFMYYRTFCDDCKGFKQANQLYLTWRQAAITGLQKCINCVYVEWKKSKINMIQLYQHQVKHEGREKITILYTCIYYFCHCEPCAIILAICNKTRI